MGDVNGLGLRIGSLFSGIGGLELGLELAGLGGTVWHSEIEPFSCEILNERWPGVPNLGDITKLKAGRIPPIDILCGGFPCQPVSLAGRGLAQDDERWLWPHFERIIEAKRPSWVVAENVPGLRSRGLSFVLRGLADLGYDAEWIRLSASAMGAPHLRERIFIVAYPGGERRQQVAGSAYAHEGTDAGRPTEEDHVSSSDGQGGGERVSESARIFTPGGVREGARIFTPERRQALADAYNSRWYGRARDESETDGWNQLTHSSRWAVEPDVGRVANGVPRRMERLKALGNAVVPQCAEFVGLCIRDAIEEAMRNERQL